jgi:hypothetical protein
MKTSPFTKVNGGDVLSTSDIMGTNKDDYTYGMEKTKTDISLFFNECEVRLKFISIMGFDFDFQNNSINYLFWEIREVIKNFDLVINSNQTRFLRDSTSGLQRQT